MYSKILKELRKHTNIKDIYLILREYTREYQLTYNQVEYLLHQYTNKG